ncbi:MAG: hypothetical protein A3I61_06420 [Acidobacteria bacterium RIFCSPLOWO2_02_FULL_68_18]|nr:MAG: hypothetical protein A3I61_06420 [Acidobacteria bacterium RIFCSPLOWO2_02_FULL_68_18]OFW50291.1 MAG: hypothetical protein A3G77_07415 [Acidobacteria bacterium RIFCSPLOWO2_12_FULL_68_19]
MTILTAAAVGWVAVILLTPWLPVPAAGIVYLFGSRLCHQIAERSIHFDGVQLPVCARCLGVYMGAAVALLPGLRSRPGRAARSPVWVRHVAILALAFNGATVAVERIDVWQVSSGVRAIAGAMLGAAVGFAVAHVLRPWRAEVVQ